ncbi:MAG: Fur family transcriptional regulator, ferric uptake regulator [Halanaerobiales bacterium]|nr:Fur family transcriptional regulator, ferric uptake regulator [Halanaerobiales bacterium]
MLMESKIINELEKNIRLTPQRKEIVRIFLENNQKHLSAFDIYDLIKEKDLSIGMATIYRTLDLLEEKGLIAKRDFGDDLARYEFIYKNKGKHHHLICKNCGKIIEISNILPPDLKERLLEEEGFQCTNSRLEIYGYCEDCKKN